MDSKKLNELMEAAQKGDYSKLEEVKDIISEEDYEKALNLFQEYGGKSQEEIFQELARLKKVVPNQDDIIEKLKPFLDEEQKSKLDKILQILDDY
ncbi:MAG: hypothetical protein JJT76_17125 [Clostridiaceae bacterium]|nr:hypothetical protein [Clostridiaceae bacterium]